MILKRIIASAIDFAILLSVYFTILGIMNGIYYYGPFLSGVVVCFIIYYLYGINDGIGKRIVLIRDSNFELTNYERMLMYPVTQTFMYMTLIAAIYPFFILVGGSIGLLIIVCLYGSLILVLIVKLILLILNKDYWNIKKKNNVIQYN